MSRSLGAALPEALLERFTLERAGEWADVVIPIATVDRLARPHPALLSYDEVGAREPTTLRLTTYALSLTSDNLRLRGALTLYLLAPGAVHAIKAHAREVAGGLAGHAGRALFEARVEDVLVDEVDAALEGAVRLTGVLRVDRAQPADGLRAALWRS